MKKIISLFLAVLMIFSCFTVAIAEESENSAVYGDHTYVRYDLSMTWTEAKEYCENLGGYLATVTSSGEEAVINSLVAKGEKAQYWLGATDEAVEGRWEWITGESLTYLSLNRSFDNAYGREDYLQVQRHNWGNESYLGFWNDSADDNTIAGEEGFYSLEHVGFICEFGEIGSLDSETNLDVPVVYIIGRTGIVREDGSGIISESTTFMTDVVEDNMDLLKDCILKGDLSTYCDVIYEQIANVYEDYRLNNEGEIENGSHNLWTWDENSLTNIQTGLYTYRFEYDARLDPCDIADDLYNYIQAIKRVTGFDRINIVSRCLGCNIATAYTAEYGWDDINTFVMYASAAKGYDFVGEMFAGKMSFTADSVNYYLEEHLDTEDSDAFEDEYLLELAKAFIANAENSGLLGAGTNLGNLIIKSVDKKESILSRILLATYATCPGYWAMVNEDNFEQAKTYIFGDEKSTTYATLIKKLDNYHYTVQNEVENMLVKMKADGVKVNIICKYGYQTPPYVKSANELGDNRIDVTGQSLGATTSKTGEKLSVVYLNKAKRKGTDKYISVDKQIDASTCLFPEYTWFIKNNVHNDFYDCFNKYILQMCRSEEQYTISTDESFPQYLFYHDGTFEPLTEDNMNNQNYTTGYFASEFRLMKAVVLYIHSKIVAKADEIKNK